MVALAPNLQKICLMLSVRFACLSVIPGILAVLPPVFAASVQPTSVIVRRVYFTPATPLEQIPLYSLDAAAPGAVSKLESEIERLYRHATTLPSGPDRRSFETRIYMLEKQLRPLLKNFDTEAWEQLRESVKNEWLSVQSALAADTEPASEKGSPTTGGAPLAAAH